MGGNELIVQGGLEAGFSLYTGYPGSPLADYFNILFEKRAELEEKGIKVVIANSEANAAAMASGAKQAGRDCMVAMKSMGLHVASDALSVGNFANPGGSKIDPDTGEEIFPGIVIVVGDDPWSISTSTPADSRYLFKHLHIPFFEPSTPQELKDWVDHALQASKRTSVYHGLLLTTFMAEGGGRVEIGSEKIVDKSLPHIDPK
ncbi:MAG: indolepyruvate ferredoxin oxidoreductase, partial [Bacteriovoracaceae bacterium]